jgi:hypothetical protein
VVVTRAFWAKALSANPQIVGKTMTLNGTAYIVIGVLARDPGFFLQPIDCAWKQRFARSRESNRSAQ